MIPWRGWQRGVGWVAHYANGVLSVGLLLMLAVALVLRGTWMGVWWIGCWMLIMGVAVLIRRWGQTRVLPWIATHFEGHLMHMRLWEWGVSLIVLGLGLGWPQWPMLGMGYGDLRSYGVVIIGTILTVYVMAIEWDQSEKWALPMMVTSLFGVVSLGYWALGWTRLLMALMVVIGTWIPWVLFKKGGWHRDGIERPLQLLLVTVAIVGCRGTSQPLIDTLFQTGLMIQYLFTIPGMVMGAFLAVYLAYYRLGMGQWVVVPLLPIALGFVLGPDAGMMLWVSFGYIAPMMGILFSHTALRMAGLSLLMSGITYGGYPHFILLLSSQSSDTRATVGIGFIVCWLVLTLLSNQLRYEWTLDGVVRARMKRKRRHDVSG